MTRAINTFFYVAILIALAGVVLGALYGAVVGIVIGAGTALGDFGSGYFDLMVVFEFIAGMAGLALLGVVFGGYFGVIGGVPLGIVVGIAVAIAQSRYERPYTAQQARFIGRVGDVVALIICIGVTIIGSLSGEGSVFMLGIPAIIAFLACHKVVLRYLRKHTHAGKSKAKNIA